MKPRRILRDLTSAIAFGAIVLIPVAGSAKAAITQDPSDPLKDDSRWLAGRYLEDPVATAKLAQRLAGSSDRQSRDVLVHWIQYTLAREFVPSIGPNAERARLVLHALAEGTDPDGLISDTTAGLRMWLDASTTDDAEMLFRLAHKLYSRPETYGGRYLLLLANLLDARKEPELNVASRRIRERLLAEVSIKLQGLDRPEFDQPYGVIHYWYCFAASREAELLKREAQTVKDPRLRLDLNGKAFMHISNAADVNRNGVRHVPTAWFDEASLMQGGKEFLTPAARAHEERAAEFHDAGFVALAAHATTAALRRYVQATLVDGAALPALQEAASRLTPSSKWQDVWSREAFQFAAKVRLDGFKAADSSSSPAQKEWRVIFLRDPKCLVCKSTFTAITALSKDFPRLVSVMEVPGSSTEPNLVPNVPYLVAPDGRYVRLPLNNWDALARVFLSLSLPDKISQPSVDLPAIEYARRPP